MLLEWSSTALPDRPPHIHRALVALAVLAALAVSPGRVTAAARPELDAVSAEPPSARAAARLERLRSDPDLLGLARVTEVDDQFGVPTFVWAMPGEAVPSSKVAGARSSAAAIEQSARDQILRLSPLYGLTREDARGAVVRYTHDTGRGGIVVAFRQSIDGIEVFRDELKVMLDRKLALVAASGYIASRSTLGREPLAFRLSPEQALDAAVRDFGIAPKRTPNVKRVYFHAPDRLVPGYQVVVAAAGDAYAYVISADDGAMLFRHRLIQSDAYSYRVWADGSAAHTPLDGPQGTAASPHPDGIPTHYDPPLVPPTLVTLESGPISTHDPWLPPGALETIGNNVDAFADLYYPEGFTEWDFRASITGPNSFDRTFDTSMPPDTSADQQMAAVTQLFYVCNWFHDWYYDAGFDEEAGNAQASNYGRGGLEGDMLEARAEDFHGYSNATIYTPPDGEQPAMQVLVFLSKSAVLQILSPPAIAGEDSVDVLKPFGQSTFDLTGDVVYVRDVTAPFGNGCESNFVIPVAGKIALIDRGDCLYDDKVKNAIQNGAIGVLIANNLPGPFDMTGRYFFTVPALSISKASGDRIKAQLAAGVRVRMLRNNQLKRDGSLDNQIVAHEWGHMLSNRLVGDALGLTTNQSMGLGEGWADFNALLMTVRREDRNAVAGRDFTGTYSIGAYAMSRQERPGKDYYFGVRRVPYSIDMRKDPLTFHHIQQWPLPTNVAYAFGADGIDNPEVHNTGEVWCTMLWECYASLLRFNPALPFDQARERMRDYFVSSLMMTPNRPTLTEARDALLAAAFAHDPADYASFCAAFARRGAGMGARSPNRNATDNYPAAESYLCQWSDIVAVGAGVQDGSQSCDADGYLDDGETSLVTLALRNTGNTTLVGTTVTVTSTNPSVSFPGPNTLSPLYVPAGGAQEVLVPIRLDGALGPQVVELDILYSSRGLTFPGTRRILAHVYANVDEVPSALETFESKTSRWATEGPTNPMSAWRRVAVDASHHRFHVPDPSDVAEQYLISPPFEVGATDPLVIAFRHAYRFDADGAGNGDGGVVEVSDDGGATWTDVGAFATPGYSGTLSPASSNPLHGRAAFVGESPGYPAMVPVSVNLGTRYASRTVSLRFRMGADDLNDSDGWDVDDVEVNGLVHPPFVALDIDVPMASSGTLAAALNPARAASPVELTATVTPRVVAGTATFYDGAVQLGTTPVGPDGRASFTVSGFAPGTHDLTAVYSGDPCHAGSTTPVLALEAVDDPAPVIHVASPNGGEDLIVGNNVEVAWTATDVPPVAIVSLELSRDRGTTWEPLVSEVPNAGHLTWNVTGPGTNIDEALVFAALLRVIAYDGYGAAADTSDAPFSIFDLATAVTITRLDAEASEDGVAIHWALSSAAVFAAIVVERSAAETGPWTAIEPTTTRRGDETVAVDRDVRAGRSYWYRLTGVSSSGTRVALGVVKGTAGAPKQLALRAAWPNPTTGAMHTEFAVPADQPVRIALVDLQGREVHVLASGPYAAGRYPLDWDGRTDHGPAPTGLYFLRLHTASRDLTTRVVIAR